MKIFNKLHRQTYLYYALTKRFAVECNCMREFSKSFPLIFSADMESWRLWMANLILSMTQSSQIKN